ncbi:hypothetical protein J7K50_06520 [bacterium]|nr:hypothetical protein [bacterium]
MKLDYAEVEDRLLAIDPGKWDLTLERLARVSAHLGDPQNAVPCILVGGSNGKGSVIAFLTSILVAPDEPPADADVPGGRAGSSLSAENEAALEHRAIRQKCADAKSREIARARAMLSSRGATPLKVGSFVKPHLLTLRARVRINGEPASELEFAQAANEAFKACDETGISLTYFELTFLIAAIHFRNAGADIALYEVGIGGRFDAVNVCRPFMSLITNVGADHEQYLGRTAAEQAFEKAGIIPEDGILVWGGSAAKGSDDEDNDDPSIEADRVIAAEASRKNCALIRTHRSFRHVNYDYTHDRRNVAIRTADLAAYCGRPVGESECVLATDQLGTYQDANLDCTFFALLALKELGLPRGIAALRTGLLSTRYRGRFEILRKGETRVILDAAHNPDGLQKLHDSLVAYLGPLVGFDEEKMKPPVIFSCQEGKDISALIAEIAPIAKRLYAISVPVLKPMPADTIADAARKIGLSAGASKSIGNALVAAERTKWASRTIVVCGSVYSLGDVIRALEKHGYE